MAIPCQPPKRHRQPPNCDRPYNLPRCAPGSLHGTARLACVLAFAVCAAVAAAAERRLIEAEEFDGLKRYPYHVEDASGWYARESNCRHYGAPGKGYHAQIHEGATEPATTKNLPNPLPPGRYMPVTGNQPRRRPNTTCSTMPRKKGGSE